MASMHDVPTMALVVRRDLKLSTGKTAAQCAHAAVDVGRAARRSRLLERWRAGGARKVVLAVQDLDGMNELHASVPSGCYSSIVTDAGRTEVPAGTQTVVGILGPRRTMDTLLRHLESL